MRSALIHGALLVVMLVYGYRTWTRDKSIQPDLGSVVLWDKAAGDLVSLEFKSDKKITKLERRTQGGDSYWWGIETTIEKVPKSEVKPPEPPKPADGSGAGSAGSGSAAGSAAGSGSAATPPAVVEEEIRKTHEFPLGEAADTLLKGYAKARALRDLGSPTEDQKKDYKLNDVKTTLIVSFKDGKRSFLVGGSVYGGSDRYVADEASKRAYVFSKDLISSLEFGESSLHLLDPRGFETSKIESVTIEGAGKSKTAARVQTGVEGQQIKTWGDPATKKADQTIANFIDNSNNLRPTEYRPEVKVADLTLVLKLTYKDARGDQLGTLQLYKREKAGELPPNTELDPANPPKGETEYLIMTEKTRVPAVVRKDTAQRTEEDIVTVFSDHPTSIEPKGNPFGNTPLPSPNPHGAPANPHGAAPAGGGSNGAAIAPTPAGSAAPVKLEPDAPKPPGAGAAPAPAKADAPKPPAPAPAPAKADAPKPPAAAPTPNPAPAATQNR